MRGPDHLFHLRRHVKAAAARIRAEAAEPAISAIGEEALAGESLVRFEDGAAPVRHQVFAGPAARFRDAIRVGEDEEGAGDLPSPLRGGRTCEPSPGSRIAARLRA